MSINSSFASSPFSYDFHMVTIPGKNSEIMIVAHGMGANYRIVQSVESNKTLVTFNFPDYDYHMRSIRPYQTTYGTIDEILPLLYVIKKNVIIDAKEKIDLYGFSAGGGAIINAIGILNTKRFDKELEKIGVFQEEKQKMLKAIEKGLVILDVPLKSVQEIVDFRTEFQELAVIAKRYVENDMDPISTLKYLQGLSLNVILHFQNPDEILSNRDDDLFLSRLKIYNAGTTHYVAGKEGGHNSHHKTLWNFYHTLIVD